MPACDGCWAEGSASERACAANPSVPCAVEVAPDNRKGEVSEDKAPSWFSGRRRRRFRPFTPCGSHRERGAGWTERLSSSSRSPRRRRQPRPGLWPGGPEGPRPCWVQRASKEFGLGRHAVQSSAGGLARLVRFPVRTGQFGEGVDRAVCCGKEGVGL